MSGDFPPWLRRKWASGDDFSFTKEVVEGLKLHTVCQSAHCPNIGECWSKRTATVMVLGNVCTRNCSFCSVPSGQPEPLDSEEPMQVARAVKTMGLKHAVVTTVVRDDLPDGGAAHIASTIEAIHRENSGTTVEVLVSDYHGQSKVVRTILDAAPEVFSHNVETVRRLYPQIRDQRFRYENALETLRIASRSSDTVIVKSGMMVGHGETEEDVVATMEDLLEAGCDALCVGQYLRPTKRQGPVRAYVTPEQFEAYEKMAYEMGFKFAVSGPFVRSSYRSEEIFDAPFARERLAAVKH